MNQAKPRPTSVSSSATLTGVMSLVLSVAAAAGCQAEPTGDEGIERTTFALHEPLQYAFMWNHQASAPFNQPYAPHPDYVRSSPAANITITRVNVGTYSVVLPGVDGSQTGIPHVTAHGNDDRRCSMSNFSWNGSATLLGVICLTPNGTFADSRWMLTHTVRNAGVGSYYYAHLYHHVPEAPVGTDVEVFVRSFNSTFTKNIVTRTAAGKYTVKLSGWTGGTNAGTVQVSHNLFNNNLPGWRGSCQHNGTTFLAGGRVDIKVVCVGENGVFTNNYFNLTFSNLSAAGGRSAGYVHHHDISAPLYTPTSTKRRVQINGTTLSDTIQIENVAGQTGYYNVYYNSSPSLNGIGSVPLVTAFGTNGEYCKIESWGGTAPVTVNTRCRDRLGGLLDTKFNAAYVTDQQ